MLRQGTANWLPLGQRCLWLLLLLLASVTAQALDLSRATVVTPANLSRQEEKSVAMLLDEAEKRSQVRWQRAFAWPSNGASVIAVGPESRWKEFAGPHSLSLIEEPAWAKPEGFRIFIPTNARTPAVFVVGRDSRGILFGVGHLLRSLRISPKQITLGINFSAATS